MTLRVLGIDPGLQKTGWGIIEARGNALSLIGHGLVKTDPARPMAERLSLLHHSLSEIVATWNPDAGAVEETFVNRNPASSLKLGQARGAALAALAGAGLDVAEYAPNLVKKAIVGTGRAEKGQIGMMVPLLLNARQSVLSADEADALAVAICHVHHIACPDIRRKINEP